MMIQPKSPTEVLVTRLPHDDGITWVFHDPMTGFVRHLNVPNIRPVAQQQPSQGSAQASHGNEMVLYQPPSNQNTQQVTRTTLVAQPMAIPSSQPASLALPMVPPLSQPALAAGQQVDWTSKIAEVIRD